MRRWVVKRRTKFRCPGPLFTGLQIHVGHYAMGNETPVAVKQHIQKVSSGLLLEMAGGN